MKNKRLYFHRTVHSANFFLALLLFSFQAAFPSHASAQTTVSKNAYTLYKSIPVEARYITTDKLQQFYLINDQNDLIKYNPAGVEVFRYSNNKLGDLATVDVSNPFHLLLYYPEFGNLITLDRTLSETSVHNLIDMGIVQTQAVGVSFDNNIWVYDELEFRLRKYDKQGNIIVESPNMATLLSEELQPISVQENNNQVYLHDPEAGLLLFDIFGQYLKKFPIEADSYFQIRDGHLLVIEDQALFICQLETGIKHPVKLPIKIEKNMQLRLEQNCFFVLKEKEVKIYRRR